MMTQDMMSCGLNGWLGMALMSVAGFLLLLVLLLGIAALGRYLLFGSGANHREKPT